jgi:hypothetical protein
MDEFRVRLVREPWNRGTRPGAWRVRNVDPKTRLPLRSLRDEIAVTRDRYGSCVTSVAGPDGGATLYEK